MKKNIRWENGKLRVSDKRFEVSIGNEQLKHGTGWQLPAFDQEEAKGRFIKYSIRCVGHQDYMILEFYCNPYKTVS